MKCECDDQQWRRLRRSHTDSDDEVWMHMHNNEAWMHVYSYGCVMTLSPMSLPGSLPPNYWWWWRWWWWWWWWWWLCTCNAPRNSTFYLLVAWRKAKRRIIKRRRSTQQNHLNVLSACIPPLFLSIPYRSWRYLQPLVSWQIPRLKCFKHHAEVGRAGPNLLVA